METAMRTLQITLPVKDASFLRHLSDKMGWQIKIQRTSQTMPKTKMSRAEFREKLEQSSMQAASGQTIRMHKDETSEQFINRLICM